jgi:enterochelin esterase-like enzyme
MNKNIKTWCSLILSILSLIQEKPIFGDSGELIILNNFQHQGKLCGSGRDIQVWLPPKYNANTDRYPVVYFFDGESVLSSGDGKPGRQTLDMDMAMLTLLAKDLITPAILVTIPNAQGGSHDEQLKKGNKRQDIVQLVAGFPA